ncbi:hypothetical protein [uncultured Thiodictyon sp.]|uniref:hypothetical protein n=1 Tax=uncultured Thiodictyon sp. TaxID=1846217 RepID=UPI0025F1E45E|nr:hypothetical protein [uncultured Thiodictyon sp.]
MTHYQLIGDKERLCRAVQWISDTGNHTACGVEEAAKQFDLSPLDEEFLLRYLAQTAAARSKPPE